jgi:exodeoxyribonuclease VII small subunit
MFTAVIRSHGITDSPRRNLMSTARTDSSDELTFEQALGQLQDAIASLESGALSLDETIVTFRQATELAAHCQRMIAGAELRITELSDAADQEGPAAAGFTQVPF